MRRRHNPPRRHPVIEIGLAEQNGASGRFKEGRAVTLPHLIPEVARGQAAIGRRSLLVIQLRSAEIECLGQNAVSSNAGQRNTLPMHLYIPHPHFAVQRSSPLMTEDDLPQRMSQSSATSRGVHPVRASHHSADCCAMPDGDVSAAALHAR